MNLKELKEKVDLKVANDLNKKQQEELAKLNERNELLKTLNKLQPKINDTIELATYIYEKGLSQSFDIFILQNGVSLNRNYDSLVLCQNCCVRLVVDKYGIVSDKSFTDNKYLKDFISGFEKFITRFENYVSNLA